MEVRVSNFLNYYKLILNINKGGLDSFTVAQGDYINQVEIWSGRLIDGIQFRTKNGQSSRKFGGGGGGYSSVYAPFPGAQLIAISGRSGRFLDAIQLIWKSTQFVTVIVALFRINYKILKFILKKKGCCWF
jgi:hypothetical protein